ncbi:MAG: bifunctional DNA-formamidopyrimidine glycosylase/DNA-(apurinic or apyrimidinic site) lyase [Pseudomonadales bacterium]|nr:bifunctional DNA-formamidopyrimidine glycosylase/DNA-(apurinic or apyrimidinic site) lyase [Pseudomonadales bacterium]
MPELPEVETTRRGIEPHIVGCAVDRVTIRQPKLRWPITEGLAEIAKGQRLKQVHRRGKYLLLEFDTGHLLIHLGMSGNLRVLQEATTAQKHDHVDIDFEGGSCLRFTDPRRFGAVLWIEGAFEQHPLLAKLGPEPLSAEFNAQHLFERSRKRAVPIKNFIMDQAVVVGVGNIYANEALHIAGILPSRKAGSVSLKRYQKLVAAITNTLEKAIEQGGSSIRDFLGNEGKPGYFQQSLQVYGRSGEPCHRCQRNLAEARIGQRQTVFCERCQS